MRSKNKTTTAVGAVCECALWCP